MRRPFEKLMALVDSVSADSDVTLGQLADEWGEDVHRIMDAMDAVRVLKGERTYI